MMTRLVFVRHGESMGNIESRFYGNFDGPLTEKGRRQARLAADYLADWHFDAAYASDLCRAYDTGCAIAARHPGLEVIKDARLREIFAGEWENVPFAELAVKYCDEYALWMTDLWRAQPVGGESIAELALRVRTAAWDIARKNEGRTVLIATHATPIRTLQCEWQGAAYEDIQHIKWVQNASVSVADYDTSNSSVNLITLGDASFQGDNATPIPTDV